MSWIFYCLYILIISAIIYRKPFFHLPGLPRTSALFFFALKIIAGIAVWYVYTFYYPQREYADIWKYYDDSEIVYRALEDHPGDYFRIMSGIGIDERIQHTYFDVMLHWDQQFENNLFNDSHTIIRFNALVRLISGGNYHTHSLFMSLLAMIGLCAIYRWIYPILFQWKKLVAFLLFVSPSLLFWSSGVLKEGILFFSLGMLIYHAWKFREDRKKYRLIWIVLTIVLLAMAKLYMLVFIVPALLAGLYLVRNPRFAFAKVLTLFVVLISIGAAIHYSIPNFSPFKIIATKQKNFINLAKGGTYVMNSDDVCFIRPDQRAQLIPTDTSGHFRINDGTEYICWKIADDFKDTLMRVANNDTGYTILSENPVAGSLMDVTILEPTLSSIIKESPAALSRSIFRPWPWEFKSAMIIPPLLENLLMYLLLAFALIAWKKPSSKAFFWFCVIYVILALTVTGLTTPVLGAMVRYRIAAQVFLFFAILMCIDREKLVKKMPFLMILF